MQNREVKLKEVFDLLKDKSNKWNDIGQTLDVPYNFREGLRSEATGQNKLEEVLHKWIESKCSNVTWDHLLNVLEKLELRDSVGKVKTYLYNDDHHDGQQDTPTDGKLCIQLI